MNKIKISKISWTIFFIIGFSMLIYYSLVGFAWIISILSLITIFYKLYKTDNREKCKC